MQPEEVEAGGKCTGSSQTQEGSSGKCSKLANRMAAAVVAAQPRCLLQGQPCAVKLALPAMMMPMITPERDHMREKREWAPSSAVFIAEGSPHLRELEGTSQHIAAQRSAAEHSAHRTGPAPR